MFFTNRQNSANRLNKRNKKKERKMYHYKARKERKKEHVRERAFFFEAIDALNRCANEVFVIPPLHE